MTTPRPIHALRPSRPHPPPLGGETSASEIPITLAAPRVFLTRYRMADALEVWAALEESRATLARWTPSIARRQASAEVVEAMGRMERWWERRERLVFAIRERGSQRFLGEVGLYHVDWTRRSAEVGFWLRDSGVGRGYMAEALGAVIRAGFGPMGLHRLEALIDPDNRRSQAVVEHAGFVLSGHAPARPGIDRPGSEVWLYVLDDPERAGPLLTTLLRPAEVADAEAIVTIRITSWQWAYRGVLPDSYLEGLPDSFERRRHWWADVIAVPPTGTRVWVAEEAGEVVGYLAHGPGRDPDAEGRPEIYEFYVRPDRTGAGNGRTLLRHAEAELARSQPTEAMLWVFATNARGRHFYEVSGWTYDGATRAVGWPSELVTELRMRKLLKPGPTY